MPTHPQWINADIQISDELNKIMTRLISVVIQKVKFEELACVKKSKKFLHTGGCTGNLWLKHAKMVEQAVFTM